MSFIIVSDEFFYGGCSVDVVAIRDERLWHNDIAWHRHVIFSRCTLAVCENVTPSMLLHPVEGLVNLLESECFCSECIDAVLAEDDPQVPVLAEELSVFIENATEVARWFAGNYSLRSSIDLRYYSPGVVWKDLPCDATSYTVREID